MRLYARYLSIIKEKAGKTITVCDFEPEDKVIVLFHSLKERESEITGTYSVVEKFVPVTRNFVENLLQDSSKLNKNVPISYNKHDYDTDIILKFAQDLAMLNNMELVYEYQVITDKNQIRFSAEKHGKNTYFITTFSELELWAKKVGIIN